MKKVLGIVLILGVVCLGGIFFISNEKAHILKGTYENDRDKPFPLIQLTIDEDENTYVFYIEQREVERGKVIENDTRDYTFKSEKREFKVNLKEDDSFAIIAKGINNGEQIILTKATEVKQYFYTPFGDEEEYMELII
ncbi:MAG: hypothetical protein ACRCTZ_13940 [Sarcina sp.]